LAERYGNFAGQRAGQLVFLKENRKIDCNQLNDCFGRQEEKLGTMVEQEPVESSATSLGSAMAGPGEDFIRLFTQAQRALYLYIMPLVSSSADADEILQETNVVIWSKWSQFTPGTNFVAWGRAIARLEVFRYRRRRDSRLQLLGDDVVELIAEQSAHQISDADQRRDALAECVNRLRERDRELIQRRYNSNVSGDEVAEQLGRPANSVYQSLGRIRRVLMECVRRRLSSAGAAT
jgi:RNA polymerase sigma-70 factor, ECF subfamily